MRLLTTARTTYGCEAFNPEIFEYYEDDCGKLIVQVREIDPSGTVSEVLIEQVMTDSLVPLKRMEEIADTYNRNVATIAKLLVQCPCEWHRSRYMKWKTIWNFFFIFINTVKEDARYLQSVNLSIR